MKNITVGITAHVDSGKTTLAEAMLYSAGEIRKLGRVDNGSSFLDTDSIERDRGITIFASQAELSAGDKHITLLDTPGHIDFSAETERTMRVMDCAILVISGTDGVQSHTSTLWKLLRKYEVPVFIFVNKMDLIGADRVSILEKLRRQLSDGCTDFTVSADELSENAAACDEALMEEYLEKGALTDESIAKAIAERKIFPCFFGSALKMDGVEDFLAALGRYTTEPERSAVFGAKVYKIAYDSKGTRLTHLKIMGGALHVRDEMTYTDAEGNEVTGKVSSVRFYSGEKFRTADAAEAGEVCAVTGLDNTFAGQGIGCIRNSERAVLEPVMTYKIQFPSEKNAYDVLRDMRRLEDEDPQLHIVWNEQRYIGKIRLRGHIWQRSGRLQGDHSRGSRRRGTLRASAPLCRGASAYDAFAGGKRLAVRFRLFRGRPRPQLAASYPDSFRGKATSWSSHGLTGNGYEDNSRIRQSAPEAHRGRRFPSGDLSCRPSGTLHSRLCAA